MCIVAESRYSGILYTCLSNFFNFSSYYYKIAITHLSIVWKEKLKIMMRTKIRTMNELKN